jgi:hypothetical protein
MNMIVKTEDEYEDLLGQWADLESGLAMVLANPDSVQEFEQRIYQYDHWMQDLLKHDADIGLYLLFQLAANSPVGYSASHALVCSVLCQLLSTEFSLPQPQRNSLVRAALTMNLAMTVLQDQLATQRTRPNKEQQIAIQAHSAKSALMLANKGITDELWLGTVQQHHKDESPEQPLTRLAPSHLLAHILQVVDRYAAMISPRQSREGQNATESAQRIVHGQSEQDSAVGQALVRVVGIYPPGTYVRLDSNDVAIVTRRSVQANQPDVAIVIDPTGKLVRPSRLCHTTQGNASISCALAGTAVQDRINHHRILQLGAQI